MAVTFNLSGSVTLDESAGLQNSGLPASAPAGDRDDNDVLLSGLQSRALDFYNRLFGTATGQLALPTTYPSSVGVAESATTLLTVTGTFSNLAFTNSTGALLNGADSGLTTLTGQKILLYTDPTNDNIVLGKVEGTGLAGTADDTVAFAAYIDPGATTGSGATSTTPVQIWMVTFQPIKHPNGADADDAVSILQNTLFVTAEGDLTFNLDTLASGQNRWNAFGDQGNQIIVISDQANQTINTSKGGGSTTIGNSNQLLDGVGSSQDGDGEKIVLTFVKNAGNLLTADKGTLSGITYTELQNAKAAQWSVAQTQGGSPYAVATMTALSTAVETGADFFTGLSNDGDPVDITSVTITNPLSGFTFSAKLADANADGEVTMLRTVSNKLSFTVTVTFNDDGTVTVEGLRAKDAINYTTAADHNRLVLHNSGVDASSLDWDIGGFKLLQTEITSRDVGPSLKIEDDGPVLGAGDSILPLTTDDTDIGSNGGDADGSNATNTANANVTNLFTAAGGGTDGASAGGQLTYALGVKSAGVASGLTDTLTGQSILLRLNATTGVVEGYLATAGTLAFTVAVDADGKLTLTQLRAVVHPSNLNILGLTSADLITLTATTTDSDGDTAQHTRNIGDLFRFEDDGPSVTANGTIPTLTTDDTDAGTTSGDLDSSGKGGQTSADFTGVFTKVYGQDGQAASGALIYALGVTGTNPASGLTDTLTGQSILLRVNATTGVVEGYLATAGTLAFTVSVAANGTVTLTQLRAVVHDNASDPSETGASAATLAAANLVTLTATVKDGDGDTAPATANIGQNLTFEDAGPTLSVSNLIGSGTTLPQIGFWSDNVAADSFAGTSGKDGFADLSLALTSYKIGTTTKSAGSNVTITEGAQGSYSVKIIDDWNQDGTTAADESLDFTLMFKDNGTYELVLAAPRSSTTTFDTASGALKAGGPNSVQTLVVSAAGETKDVVFFNVNPTVDLAPDGTTFPSTDTVPEIWDAIGYTVTVPQSGPNVYDGTFDLTEPQVEAANFSFIDNTKSMNVSTAGIGVGNNNLNGYGTAAIQATDESFIVNPQDNLASARVFIDNSVAGYNTTTEDLYYRIYYENGTVSNYERVTAAMLRDEAGGQKSFLIDGGALNIDAIQLTMGRGEIKIPNILLVYETNTVLPDVGLNFAATITDGDGDTQQAQFSATIETDDNLSQEPDLTYLGTLSKADSFVFDMKVTSDPSDFEADRWLVTDFFSADDTLVLLGVSGFSFNSNVQLNASASGIIPAGADLITVGSKTIIIDNGNATITSADVLAFA